MGHQGGRGDPAPDIYALCSALIQKEATRGQQRVKGHALPTESGREELVQEGSDQLSIGSGRKGPLSRALNKLIAVGRGL